MHSLYATETVWDGTPFAAAPSGAASVITVGHDDVGWAPEHLLLAGVEGSLMDSFLAAAQDADIDVLGYVSSAQLDLTDEPGALPRCTLRPCVVVGSPGDARRAALLTESAAARSVGGRLLGDRLRVIVDVRVESSCPDPGPWSTAVMAPDSRPAAIESSRRVLLAG